VHDFSDGEFRSSRNQSRNGKRRFDNEETFAKRNRHRLRLPAGEEVFDGLPEGDRWSTWDQSKILVSNDLPTERGFRWRTGSIRKLKRFIHLVKRQPVSILRFQ